MIFKFGIYIVIAFLVIWCVPSINFNQIFKKNANPYQARVFTFLICLSIIYLITNFIIDLLNSIKIF